MSATFAPRRTALVRRDDGSLLYHSRDKLGDWPKTLAHVFRAAAETHPDRLLIAERDEQDRWCGFTYGEMRTVADGLAQALLDRGLGPDRPLLILSRNSVAHLQLTLGAYTAGVPVIPVSVAYSLMSRDHERIRAIAELTEPGMVFAEDAAAFGPALDAVASLAGNRVVISRGERLGVERLADLIHTKPTADVERALAGVGQDHVAKLLFTSGSTGTPKGVINTHRMLCSNQVMLAQIWPFLASEPPILVDWLPWSHTFGANHNMNLVLHNAGTIYLDDGKPAPHLFQRTLTALREIPPTVYVNVPAGYGLLAPALEADPELARRFFSRMQFMFYAGAALNDELARRMRLLSEQYAERPVPLTSSWGATETAPAATSAHFSEAVIGCMGVPLAGVTLKLAPVGEKLEVRVKGPIVTPGYHRQPELTAEAFDDEGFYKTGDAVRLVDEDDPDQGLLFDGRIAENLKLATGTWVTVGRLRTRLLDATGVLTDAVICGANEQYAASAWVAKPDPG